MEAAAAGSGGALAGLERHADEAGPASTLAFACPEAGCGQLSAAPQTLLELQKAAVARCAQGLGAMPPPPPKCGGLPLASGSLATSCQLEALTAPPSRLLLSETATEEKDEYLLRLLRKAAPPPAAPALHGAPPPVPHQQAQQLEAAAAQPTAAVFRAPVPVRRPAGGATAASAPVPPSAAPTPLSPTRLLSRAASTSLASPSAAGGFLVPSLPSAAHSTGTGTATDQAVPSPGHMPAVAAAAAAAALPPRAASLLPLHSRAPPPAVGVPLAVPVPPEASASFSLTRQRLGDEMAYSVRNTMIRQQVMFLEQLYDLHRAIAIQKLLMHNCPEVQQVMGEAMRLMSSVGSQHGSGSGRGSKHQRTTPNGGATVPGSGSGDDPSSFRPDSQFAAVPQLPGGAQTCGDDDDGGSGDPNGSGSGQNGSGGGSTSPQQGVTGLPPLPPPTLPYMYLAHTAVATPSGASAAPVGWQWGMAPGAMGPGQQQVQQMQQAHGLPPVPQGPPQMAPWVGQDAGLAAVGINPHQPQHGAAGAKPAGGKPAAPGAAPAQPQQSPPQSAPGMPPPGMPMPPPGMGFGPAPPMMMSHPGAGMPGSGNDPLSWWYQNYYGTAFQHQQHQQAQAQQMAGMSLATAQAAAAAAAALMPAPPRGAAGCTTAHAPTTAAATATKWWHDPALTFGPPVDTEMLARRPPGGLAALAGGRDGPEVQSAPAGQPKLAHAEPPRSAAQRRGGLYSEGRVHHKRKATADADEASSGTTGHDYPHDHEANATSGFKRQESLRARSARATPRGIAAAAAADAMGGGAQDENAAELLLAIGKQ